MPTVQEAVAIDCSPAEVWAYVSRAENWPTFDQQLIRVEQLTPHPVGLGTRWRGETNVLGRALEWTVEVTSFEHERVLATTAIAGKVPFEFTYSLAAVDGSREVNRATVLTCRVVAEAGLGGAFGRLADAFVQRAYSRSVRVNLATLKELVELGA
jgi:ligand-binding SRPBCC domain-containing protein